MRLFIAIELPRDLQGQLDRKLAALNTTTEGLAVRWVSPAAVHLTLKFLGEVGREQVSRITEKLDSAASKVDTFTVEVEGIGCFPSCKRPRIIWIGVQADQTPLKDLQSDIEADMEQLGFDREQRRFHPHLTVGRLKRSASNAQRRALAQELELIQVGHLGKIEVSGITLMRSELHPTGAEYTQLHRAALG